MSTAHVQSVPALVDFRTALTIYVAESKQGLMAMDTEIRRAVDWVAVDRAQYWRGEIRRATDAVARARDDLHNARIFKRMDDYVPSCIDEKKALQRAQERLQNAELKAEAVKRWGRAIQHELNEFTGRMAQFATMLEADLPKAVATLERILDALDRYTSMSGPGAMSARHVERLEKESQSIALPVEEPEVRSQKSEVRDQNADVEAGPSTSSGQAASTVSGQESEGPL